MIEDEQEGRTKGGKSRQILLLLVYNLISKQSTRGAALETVEKRIVIEKYS
jgi:hypothetical protein